MKTAEEQIRDLLKGEEQRAPLAADAMPGIQRGIVRSRQRRMGAVVAAAVAVAAAITVPVVVHNSAHSGPAKTPTATHSAKPVAPPGITLHSMFAPTWLPAGLVETGRNGQIHSRPHFPASMTRVFSATNLNNKTSVAITDAVGPESVPKSATPVTVAGRAGMGWVDEDTQSYAIQVKWSAHHWLQIGAGNGQPAKSVAVHVANSIVARTATLYVPITCSGPGCTSFNVVGVSGTNRDMLIQVIGDPLGIELDHSPNTAPGNVGIRLSNGMDAHFEVMQGAKHPPTHAQLVAISKSFRVHGKLDFSWLGSRP